ncbi:ATP-binding cassette domain-containing protein [Flavobacterium salilacus subsp. salilacus]|uniref:ABC transporter ATP-binding protein n=1 Tax=Flavobacterium TaxID=237 RepID=UPI00107507BA|nr:MULTISPECIES: ATP-binding cassette domain-containing protein [Flavobacterium]KAF2519102.1 ATP-binding cassette domain-containing protein [Flavobacterium salilacus subsp. salilacus]MBE1613280.1 ATP-binding cassette domain-containing protein [Flavobacterium sp. SaA2.13]
MTDYIIQTKSLNFRFSKHKKVLDDISLNIPKGAIYGFLGPNGAGKSTTMRLLTGILPEQQDAISLFGKPLKTQLPQVFDNVGALVESPALYLHLSGYNNLKYLAELRNVPQSRITEVLELVDLTRDAKRKVKQYSLGMKQRLAIAMALLDEPELLLLDEPVNGLDPNGMRDIRQLLVKLNKEKGVTIFVSSHLLAEIEKMCTHVGIISNGKLRFEGTIQQLSEQSGACKIQFTLKDAALWQEKLLAAYPSVTLESNSQLSVELSDREQIPAFTKELINHGAELYELKVLNGLEEWFMTLIRQK